MEIGVVPADPRAAAAAEAFRRRNIAVRVIGLSTRPMPPAVLLPMPLTKDNIHLFGTGEPLRDWFSALAGCRVFAGRVSAEAAALAASMGVTLVDHFADESEIILNVIPTVEGALQLAMERTPFTLHGSHTLITGFGRIARLLAHRLRALGADVTVCSRRSEDASWCEALGYNHTPLATLTDTADYDIIFNTVPAHIFTTPPRALYIELASAPGGIAPALVPHFVDGGALPGKVAPHTAGEIICKTVCKHLHHPI